MTERAQTFDLRFPEGATHLVVGPSGAGKTQRIREILRLKNELFHRGSDIKRVFFFYKIWQEQYDEMKEEGLITDFVLGFPTNEQYTKLVSKHPRSICILDDVMSHITRDLVEIVTVSARHNKASTFLLFQSLFPANPLARQISLNVKYIHLFKNPRENAQVRFLAQQLHPSNWKWIVEAYHEATKAPHSCFLFDVTQNTPDHLRYLSNFLPDEWPINVWVSKEGI